MTSSFQLKKSKSLFANYRPAILITGASSGIGLSFTEAYITHHDGKANYKVIIMIANNPQKLKKTATKLRKNFFEKLSSKNSLEILTLSTNLSQSNSIKAVMTFLKKKQLYITTLVNNAGIGYMGGFSQMSQERIHEVIGLNITAVTNLTHTIGEHMRAWMKEILSSKNPVIINVASVVGFIPSPLMSVYAASKAYVINFSEALGVEWQEEINRQGYGIEVYTLCPGSTRTAFFERAGKKTLSMNHFMSPWQIVQSTCEALRSKKFFIIPGNINRLVVIIIKIIPRSWAIKIIYRFMRSRLKK